MSNALSLFFPDDQPTPTTVDHLLTLPPLLAPISPPLATLHNARIRLAGLIKPGTLDHTAWCRCCGGLRRPNRSRDDTSNATSPTPTSRKRTRSERTRTSSSGSGTGSGSGNGNRTTRRRAAALPRTCTNCGTSFTRPTPDEAARSFPSARTLRATRSNSNLAPEIPTPIPDATSSSVALADTDVNTDLAIDSPESLSAIQGLLALMPGDYQLPFDPLASEQPFDFNLTFATPPPPRYVNNTGLTHVHTSSPQTPTYPQPPAKHASPPPKGRSKKRKQSGLAKLMADTKERESAAGPSGGSWGLD